MKILQYFVEKGEFAFNRTAKKNIRMIFTIHPAKTVEVSHARKKSWN